MEFEIKDIDRAYETADKIHDTFHEIYRQIMILNEHLNGHKLLLERISRALETIAQEMVVENETL